MGIENIEEAIMAGIDEAEGTAGSTSDVNATENTTATTDGGVPNGEENANASAEATNNGTGEQAAQTQEQQPTQQATSNGGGQNGSQQQQQAKDGEGNRSSRPDGAIEDAKGNLTLPDGKVILAGSHRRLYEDGLRHKTQAEQLGDVLRRVQNEIVPSYDRQIQTLTAQVQAYQQAANVHTQYGVSPEETVQAVKLAAAWKANPLETLKYLLAEAAAAGHNIEGMGSSVDTMAISRMIEQKIAPLTADRERAQREQQIATESASAANAFFGKFPDAKIHESLIAKLITDNPNLSPESAYYELRLSAQQKGLDWNKPLLEQMHSQRQSQQSVQQQQVQQPQQQTQAPMPNGRPNAQQVATNVPNVASEYDTMGDIVRQAMRDAGMRV